MNKDNEQLRLLGIFHHVVALIAGLFALLPVIHVALGIDMVTGKLTNTTNDPMLPIMGWVFLVFGTGFIACGLAFAVCLSMAGRHLVRHRHYMFCLVMGALACAFMPFGTVLGVLTIVVLQRDSVQALFGRVSSASLTVGT